MIGTAAYHIVKSSMRFTVLFPAIILMAIVGFIVGVVLIPPVVSALTFLGFYDD